MRLPRQPPPRLTSQPRLPLPRLASHPYVFVGLAALHVYLGSGHVLAFLDPTCTFNDVWKGLGAMAGAYYFLALASQIKPPA